MLDILMLLLLGTVFCGVIAYVRACIDLTRPASTGESDKP